MNIKFCKFLKRFIIFFSIFLLFIIFGWTIHDSELFKDSFLIAVFILGVPFFCIYLSCERIIKLDYMKKTFSIELVNDDFIISFDNKSFSGPKNDIYNFCYYYEKKFNIKLPVTTKFQIYNWLINDYWYLLKKKRENDIIIEEQDFFKRFSVTEEVSDIEKKDVFKLRKINKIIYSDLFTIFILGLLFLISFCFYPIIYNTSFNIKIYILMLCFGGILFILLLYYLLRYLKLSSFKKRFNTSKVYSMDCVPVFITNCSPSESIHDILFERNYKNLPKHYGIVIKNLNNVYLNKWFIGFNNKEDLKNIHKLYIIRGKDDHIDTLLLYKREYEALEHKKKKS